MRIADGKENVRGIKKNACIVRFQVDTFFFNPFIDAFRRVCELASTGEGVFLKGLRGRRGTYKNDNATQDGCFYGFSLFFKGFFYWRTVERTCTENFPRFKAELSMKL